MTVEKALSENFGRQIKLGFGSSFVYCDTVSKQSFDDIEEISQQYLTQFRNNLKTAKSRLKYIIEKGEKSFVKENMEREQKKIDEDRRYLKTLKEPHDEEWWSVEYYRKIGSIAKLIAETKRSIDNFVPFLEAKVFESYESVDEDALIVISKANNRVVGAFWTCDEYRNGIKEIPEMEDEDE